MQLVKAPRDAVLRPLQVVSGIVERRQTLPILANVLLRREGERLSFTATDLEIQIQTSAEFGASKESGATTVSARKLVEILRALPDGEVQLAIANRKLSIQAGRSKFNLQTLPAEEYPTVAPAPAAVDSPSRRPRLSTCCRWFIMQWQRRTSATTSMACCW